MDQKPGLARPKEEVAAILLEWEQSKLSKKTFCEQKKINYQTFIGWIVQRRNRIAKEANKFIPIQVKPSHEGIFAEIHISSTRKIILHQPVSGDVLVSLLKC